MAAFAQPKLYRWVDDNGVVHYTDSIPPEHANRDRDVLNNHGVAVGFEEGELTDAERAEQARLAAADDARRRAHAEQAKRDQILLDTYLSVAEIEDLRDERLELLDSQIKVTDHYLGNLRERLAGLQREAGRYSPYSQKADAPPMPESLSIDISRTIASIDLYEQRIESTHDEQETLREAFAADIERFKQLKGTP